MKRFAILITVLTGVSLFLSSCEKDDKKQNASFDRAQWLAYTADEIILPLMSQLEAQANAYGASVDAFVQSPNATQLAECKEALHELRLAYNRTLTYDFGPAFTHDVFNSVMVFPTDTVLVEGLVAAGSYNLESSSNVAARGFAAAEYLLLHKGESEVVSEFLTDTQRGQFLKDLKDNALSHILPMISEWKGNYRSTFVSATGTDVGSSTSLLINHWNINLELAKNAKLAIPMGKRSLGVLYPEKVESAFARRSSELLQAQTEALAAFYEGRSELTDEMGLSLKDYVSVMGSTVGNTTTASTVSQQFDNILLGWASAEGSTLYDLVSARSSELEAIYQEYQTTILHTKTEIPSLLGVSITYQDNDGD